MADNCAESGAGVTGGTVRIRQIGGRVELGVLVPAAGGAGSYGAAELDAQALRRLLAELRQALWALERGGAHGAPLGTSRAGAHDA